MKTRNQLFNLVLSFILDCCRLIVFANNCFQPNNLVFKPSTAAKKNSKTFHPKLVGSVSNTLGSLARESRVRPLGVYPSNLEIYRNQPYPYPNLYFTCLSIDPTLQLNNLYPTYQSNQHDHLLLAIPLYRANGVPRTESTTNSSSVQVLPGSIQMSEGLEPVNEVSRVVSTQDRAIQIDPGLMGGGFRYVEPDDFHRSRWKKLQVMSPARRDSRQASASSEDWNSSEEEDTKELARQTTSLRKASLSHWSVITVPETEVSGGKSVSCHPPLPYTSMRCDQTDKSRSSDSDSSASQASRSLVIAQMTGNKGGIIDRLCQKVFHQ